MRKWYNWLCPGINLKRWLFLFVLGVLLVAFGLAFVFNFQFMGLMEEYIFYAVYKVTGRYSNYFTYFIGGIFLFFGGWAMFRAMRKIIASVVSAVLPDKSRSLMETLFVQHKLTHGPVITVVGGGTGLSTLLRGMKNITNNCTAVVATGDNGGSSGRLRREMGIIPPGDLRNCLTALADSEPMMERLMQYRFEKDSTLAGHCFGNLLIAALAEAEGGMEEGLAVAGQILKVRGRVVPSTLDNIELVAEMSDGSYVYGEAQIPIMHKHIVKMHTRPNNPKAAKDAVEAIEKADVLVFGPGSLYTSIIPNLLVEEIREAVIKSNAAKVYICNVLTEPGETDGYGAYDHVKALIDHVGMQFLDFVIVNSDRITDEQLKAYNNNVSQPVAQDFAKLRKLGVRVIPASLSSKDDFARHDPEKLANVLIQLIYRMRIFGKGMQFFDYYFLQEYLKTHLQHREEDLRRTFGRSKQQDNKEENE